MYTAYPQRYERMPPPSRRRMRTLLTFLYSGMYNVVYPKTGTRSRNNSMTSVDGKNTTPATPTTPHAHKHDGCCGAPAAPATSDSDKAQYERAMKMLKGIDLAISGKVVDEEVQDIESVVETVTGMFLHLHVLFLCCVVYILSFVHLESW